MKKFYCRNNFCGKLFTLRGVFNKHCLLTLFSLGDSFLWRNHIGNVLNIDFASVLCVFLRLCGPVQYIRLNK